MHNSIDAKSVRHNLHKTLTEHKLTQMREFGDVMLAKLAGGEELTQHELDAVVECANKVAPMFATASNEGFIDENLPYQIRHSQTNWVDREEMEVSNTMQLLEDKVTQGYY